MDGSDRRASQAGHPSRRDRVQMATNLTIRVLEQAHELGLLLRFPMTSDAQEIVAALIEQDRARQAEARPPSTRPADNVIPLVRR